MKDDHSQALHESARWRGLVVLLGVYLAVGLTFVFSARTIIDEGVFLNAGRLVGAGQLPYRDFPFSQAPMLPYAYLGAPSLFGSPLIGGRMISCLMALGGMAAALWLTRRLAGYLAAVTTLCIAVTNLPGLWVGMTIRAQSIGTPLLVLGTAALALPRRGAWSWAASPSLMLWASGMRLTNLGVFVAVAVWVAWRLRRSPGLLGRVSAILGVQALVILWPVLLAPRDAFFHIVTAQWTRGERVGGVSVSFLASLKAKAGLYLDLAWDAPVLVLLSILIMAGLVVSWRRGWRPDLEQPMGDARSAQLTCIGIGFLSFVPHLALSQAFLTYLIPLWALLTPAAGIGLVRGLERGTGDRRIATAAVVLLLALAAANGVANRDVWIGSGDESFPEFRRLAHELGELGGPDCTVLTFQTNLAVEAGCDLLPGLEYSFFSYFVGMPSDEAETAGVLSGALLRERVAALRPELIAIAPANLRVLRGEAVSAGVVSPRPAGDSAGQLGEHPLDFLGSAGTPYEFRGSYGMSNGIRRPGGRGTMPLLVFTLEERR